MDLREKRWDVLKEDYGMRISKNKMGHIATIFTAVMLFSLNSGVQAADWNMWGKDAGYTSITPDSVEQPLKVSCIDIGFPGQTIIVVTHDMDVARRTDRIITMRNGKIASDTGAKGNEKLGL